MLPVRIQSCFRARAIRPNAIGLWSVLRKPNIMNSPPHQYSNCHDGPRKNFHAWLQPHPNSPTAAFDRHTCRAVAKTSGSCAFKILIADRTLLTRTGRSDLLRRDRFLASLRVYEA